jgi:UDP-2-acetamido-2-deoxy-ribo-hexuluronate aminotransferase
VQYSFDDIGCNSRLDNMQAAILDVKLKYLDEYCGARQKVAAFYDQALAVLKNAKIPGREPKSTHVFHQYTLMLSENIDRDAARKALADKGVPTMVYYPKPMHQQKAYASPRYSDKDFPISISLGKSVLSLPIHTEMSLDQLNYIADAIREIIG